MPDILRYHLFDIAAVKKFIDEQTLCAFRQWAQNKRTCGNVRNAAKYPVPILFRIPLRSDRDKAAKIQRPMTKHRDIRVIVRIRIINRAARRDHSHVVEESGHQARICRPALIVFLRPEYNRGNDKVGDGGKLHRDFYPVSKQGRQRITADVEQQQRLAQQADRPRAGRFRALAKLDRRNIDSRKQDQRKCIQTIHSLFIPPRIT